jgi:hypothetical protein
MGQVVRFSKLALNLARLKHEFKRRNWFGIPKGAPVCEFCDRVGYTQVKLGNDSVVWRCDWHTTERIPRVILRQGATFTEGVHHG